MSWIKIDRRLLEWEWIGTPNMLAVWAWLLLSVNYEDTEWHGIMVKRGQMIFSVPKVMNALGLTRQPVRSIIANLQSTGEITTTKVGKYTILTICKYDDYQVLDKAPVQDVLTTQKTTEQPATNQQANHEITSIVKEIKKEKNLSPPIRERYKEKIPPLIERKKAFEDMVKENAGDHPPEMLQAFCSYWTEHSPNGVKMRFEMEKVFDVKRRLAIWASKEYNKPHGTANTRIDLNGGKGPERDRHYATTGFDD